MRTLLAATVRIVVIGAALAAYLAALPWLFPEDGGGANIGAGLIAFAGLVLVSFGWSVLDGRARGTKQTVLCWAVVAAVVAAGWLVVQAFVETDSTTAAIDFMLFDLGLVLFTTGLVFAPAAVGAALGGLLPGPSREA